MQTQNITTKARCQLSQSQRVEVCRLSKLQDLQMLLKDFLSLLRDNQQKFLTCYYSHRRATYHMELFIHLHYLKSRQVNKYVSIKSAWSH